jgi:hypothetical protein
MGLWWSHRESTDTIEFQWRLPVAGHLWAAPEFDGPVRSGPAAAPAVATRLVGPRQLMVNWSALVRARRPQSIIAHRRRRLLYLFPVQGNSLAASPARLPTNESAA